MNPLLAAAIFLAVGVLALLVRGVLRVPPRLVPGNLNWAHVPTPWAREAAMQAAEEPTLFAVGRVDHSRGVIILDATGRAVAEHFAQPGQRLRTFGHWVFLVFRPLPPEQGGGTNVSVGVQRKWFEFGRGAIALRMAVRDAVVRDLWTKLPPPHQTRAN